MKFRLRQPLLLAAPMMLIFLMVILTSCNAKSDVTGTITYRQRIALPADAVIRVQLQDVSPTEAPAIVIGEQIINEPGQVPIEYAVSYQYRDIDDEHTYAIKVQIEDGNGQLLFTNDTFNPVLTYGHPTEDVEIVVIPVSASLSNSPATVLGEPDGQDSFENDNDWVLVDGKCFKSEIKDGKYVITSKGKQGSTCWEISWPKIENFYLEAKVEMPASCNPQDQFGIFFRAPDSNHGYLYGVSCAGEYSMLRWDGKEEAQVIVEADMHPVIATEAGQSNHLGILASADHYYLYINGEYVDQSQDSSYINDGNFGFFIRSATDQGFTVQFDDLVIWLLDDAYYPPAADKPELPDVPVESPPSEVATVTANVSVNVRSGPGGTYPIYGAIEKGITGEVIGSSPDLKWWAIKVPTSISGTGIAWIAQDYATPNNPQNEAISVVEPPLLPSLAGVPAAAPGDPRLHITEVTFVRSGPGAQYPIYGVTSVGSKARLIGVSEDHNWWAVELSTSIDPDGNGWIYKDFADTPKTENIPTIEAPRVPENIIPTPPQPGGAAAIARESISVRSGPGNQYSRYGQIPIGTAMAILGKSVDGEYWVVKIPKSIAENEQGWVAARYCSAENTEQVPVVQAPPVP